MRVRIIILSLFATAHFGFGQTPSFSKVYKPGNRLYVFTPSGLTLRDKPDIKGAAMKVLPYGTELTVEKDTQPQVPFTNSNIQGAWVKVSAGEHTGYVFDGFLSRLRAVPAFKEEEFQRSLSDYLRSQFKVTASNLGPPDSTTMVFEFVEFTNGAAFEWIGAVGGTTVRTSFPSTVLTYKEVYLLAKILYPEFFVDGKCGFIDVELNCNLDENTSLSIRKDYNSYTLMWGHAD